MEDVLTEPPPPSRFFPEDLDNFAIRSPPLPSPFLRLNADFSNPSLLIISISAASLSLLRRIPHKTLIGNLILPETSISSQSCNIYSIEHKLSTVIIVPFHIPVSSERSRAVAKTLISQIRAERILIFDSIKAENYRGMLSTDEALAFKLETSLERKGGELLIRNWEYLPTGTVMGGLGAAVLGECQMKALKATMCATWPENGWSAAAAKIRGVFLDLGFDVDADEIGDDDGIKVSPRFYSQMYA